MSFREFLSESYLNYFTHDKEKREMVVDEVWEILQDSYRPIGGIHGSGFKSKQDMVENIPFWKLVRKNGKIVTVVCYKDTNGRKLVAAGTNGSTEGRDGLARIIMDDLKRERAYMELSDKLLRFITRVMGVENLKRFLLSPKDYSKISGNEIFPVEPDDPEIRSNPELKGFFYKREIGGDLHTKVAMGVSGKLISNYGFGVNNK